jgi:hypothetical protein
MKFCYADLNTLKSRLDEEGRTDQDAKLLPVAEAVSAQIDKYCRRTFVLKTATRYFDGAETLRISDLITATTIKIDLGGDGIFETTLASSDYLLQPYNDYPKTRVIMSHMGNYGDFADGIPRGVEIAGVWGYAETATPYAGAGTLGAAITTTAGTEITLSAGHTVSAGHTIRIGTEDMYVTGGNINTVTVKRGLNGTTAATHLIGAAVSVYYYPDDIREAAIIQTMFEFAQQQAGARAAMASPESGIESMPRWGWHPLAWSKMSNYRLVLV